jgi:hypothetical protein
MIMYVTNITPCGRAIFLQMIQKHSGKGNQRHNQITNSHGLCHWVRADLLPAEGRISLLPSAVISCTKVCANNHCSRECQQGSLYCPRKSLDHKWLKRTRVGIYRSKIRDGKPRTMTCTGADRPKEEAGDASRNAEESARN